MSNGVAAEKAPQTMNATDASFENEPVRWAFERLRWIATHSESRFDQVSACEAIVRLHLEMATPPDRMYRATRGAPS